MKKVRSIGMLMAGIVIGVGISYAPDLYAASTKLLGGKVGNVLSVKLDGKKIGDGGVIGGTTYVPLRVVANNLGAEVVRVDNNEIVLSTGPDPTDVNMDQINEKREAIITQIRDLNIKIRDAQNIVDNKPFLEEQIAGHEEKISIYLRMKANNDPQFRESSLENEQLYIDKIKKSITDAENNLTTWKAEMADLEAQLAELQK